MPNGHDRNLVRLLLTVEGFRARYQRWPQRIRFRQGYIDNLQHILTEEGFLNLTSKLKLVADDVDGIFAEDDLGGVFSYGQPLSTDGEPDIPVQEWLSDLQQKPHSDHGFLA
jgi:hypothetical protein